MKVHLARRYNDRKGNPVAEPSCIIDPRQSRSLSAQRRMQITDNPAEITCLKCQKTAARVKAEAR